jgi:hypothetical protein
MKEEFRKYIDKAIERFFIFHELEGNNDNIRAFSLMLRIDAFTPEPPNEPFGHSLVTLAHKRHSPTLTATDYTKLT